MGKGLHVVIPWILDAPGPWSRPRPAPTPSPSPCTPAPAAGRSRCSTRSASPACPTGCAGHRSAAARQPRIALVRARGLGLGRRVRGRGRRTRTSGPGRPRPRCAACCTPPPSTTARALDLYRWSLNPVLAEDAVTVLTRHPDAATGWADALDATVHADPRTRDSVWLGVRQSLAALADPDVLRRVDPDPDEPFDPETFLRDAGTLFLLASAVGVRHRARRWSPRSSRTSPRPPAPWPPAPPAHAWIRRCCSPSTRSPTSPRCRRCPSLMAEGGGSGITTLAVLQSLAQARHRWGEHAADAIWDAATVKLVLGGLAKMRDLDDVSRLLGEIDEPTQTLSRGRGGERSTSTSLRQVPVMPPSVLRTLPFGTGGSAAAPHPTRRHRPRRLARPPRRRRAARRPDAGRDRHATPSTRRPRR